MLLRFLVLIVYVAAFVALRNYLRDHPPRFEGKYVYEFERLGQALSRMWGPLLWPLPGLMWIGTMPIPALTIAILSFLIPFDIFLVFFTIAGVLEPPSRLMIDKLFSWVPAVFSVFITMLIFLTLVRYTFSLWQFVVFLAFVTIPPALAVILVMWAAPNIIPAGLDYPMPAVRLLQQFTAFFTTFPKPSWMIEDGEVKTRIKGHTFSGVGPGWLMTEPENLVVLKGGTDIRRIAGPGVFFTEAMESPYQVIDLRNQIRKTRIDARTQDGIEVNLSISSRFRVNPGYRTVDLESLGNEEPWPYRNQRDIYQIVFYEEVDPTGKTPLDAHQVRPWDDIPLKVAINRVKQVIPAYSLEQLYHIVPEGGAIDPLSEKSILETGELTRKKIAATVRETVKAAVEPLGFEILGGGIGNKIVPTNPDVVKQRVEAWKAAWMSKVMDWETEAQVKNLKLLSSVRSNARVLLLSQMLQETATKLEDKEHAGRYVAHHLLENLLHLARNSQVKELLPESTLPTLTQLQALTKEE